MSEAYKTLVANDPIKVKTLLSPEVLEDAWLHDQMIKEVGQNYYESFLQIQMYFFFVTRKHGKWDWFSY